MAKNQLVVLDEAYIHFSKTSGGIALVNDYPNLIVLRTFSKVFGLAGLRVGFGIAAEEVIRPLMHIKPTWNMGRSKSRALARHSMTIRSSSAASTPS